MAALNMDLIMRAAARIDRIANVPLRRHGVYPVGSYFNLFRSQAVVR
jgi:hypothetical protein